MSITALPLHHTASQMEQWRSKARQTIPYYWLINTLMSRVAVRFSVCKVFVKIGFSEKKSKITFKLNKPFELTYSASEVSLQYIDIEPS